MTAIRIGLASAIAIAAASLAAAQSNVPPPAVPPTQAAAAVADPAMDPATAKAALKAREAQVRQWKAQYGEGPYPDEIAGFVQGRQEVLRPYFQALYTGGERNAVLNLSRLGLAAMEVGSYGDAERAFDAALLRIEAVYAKNKSAEAARSVFHKESNKDFKGEPYERAMAYYYRGLLYLRKGDYNNARASFKGAEYQDTVSEDEEFQSDFALMDYLMGWATQCAGDNGATDYETATKAQAGLTAPAAGDNVLLSRRTRPRPAQGQGRQAEREARLPGRQRLSGDRGGVRACPGQGGADPARGAPRQQRLLPGDNPRRPPDGRHPQRQGELEGRHQHRRQTS